VRKRKGKCLLVNPRFIRADNIGIWQHVIGCELELVRCGLGYGEVANAVMNLQDQ
jgi:hypothetical protein